jgi:hypothetical protein
MERESFENDVVSAVTSSTKQQQWLALLIEL